MDSKPFNGTIEDWYVFDFDPSESLVPDKNECYVVRGIILGHPWFTDGVFRTSQVLTPKCDIVERATIETLNSLYKLGSKYDNSNRNKDIR